MADNSRPISNLVHRDLLSSGDGVVSVLANGAPRITSTSTLHSNTQVATQVGKLVLGNTASTPPNNAIAVTTGEMWMDADYLYIRTATKIRRVTLEDF